MPVYEYKCKGCQAKFELRRGFGQADDPTNCPQCRGDQVNRLLSTFSAFSKGSGGATTSVGGSSCGSCSSGGCASCGHH